VHCCGAWHGTANSDMGRHGTVNNDMVQHGTANSARISVMRNAMQGCSQLGKSHKITAEFFLLAQMMS